MTFHCGCDFEYSLAFDVLLCCDSQPDRQLLSKRRKDRRRLQTRGSKSVVAEHPEELPRPQTRGSKSVVAEHPEELPSQKRSLRTLGEPVHFASQNVVLPCSGVFGCKDLT